MGRLLLIVAILLILAVVAVPLWLTGQYRSWRFWEDATDRAADVRDRVESVFEPGAERGVLSLRLLPMTPELREHFGAPEDRGVLVAAVGEASASRALEVGDVVTEVDGRAVDSPGDVARAVASRPGEQVVIELYRNGRRREREVEVGRGRRFPTPDIRFPEDFSELGERIQAVGERYGVMGEGRGAPGGERPSADPSADLRDVNALERRIEALEKRIHELESDG